MSGETRYGPGIVNKGEYRFPLALAAVFVVLGSLPYAYGYFTAPEGETFMGFVGRATFAPNGYMMLAKQVQQGNHLIENKATPEPLPRTYFNLEWWIFGGFSRITGLSLIATFHVSRALIALLVLIAAYDLAAQCLATPGARKLAVALIALGSGLGWTVWLVNKALGLQMPLPLDLQGIRISGYLINYPHFMLAVALRAWTFSLLLRGERSGTRGWFAAAGAVCFLHSMVRPYHIPETYLLLLLFPALRCLQEQRLDWGRFANYALAGVVHFPAVLYYLWLAYDGTLGISGWVRQSLHLFPNVLWMGVPFLLLAGHVLANGLRGALDARPPALMLGLWLLIAWLLESAFPYFHSGHESAFEGYSLAGPILAVLGPIPWLYRALLAFGPVARRWPWPPDSSRSLTAAGMALVVFCMPSSVYAYARMFHDLHHPLPPSRYYLRNDELAALRWLEANTKPGEVVLATDDTSPFIPVVASNKTVVGHDMLTTNYMDKLGQVNRFFDLPGDPGFKEWFLRKWGIDYLFYGVMERRRGEFRPEDYPWLAPAFTQGEVTVFRVNLP